MAYRRITSLFGIIAFTAMMVFVFYACEEPKEAPPPVIPTSSDSIINISDIKGVTIPSKDGTPVTSITENAQYGGTVIWSPNHTTFVVSTEYTATITLTAKPGFTLQGVEADFFKVAGAISVSNAANSGVITAVFISTGTTIINIAAIQGVDIPVKDGTPVTSITENEQYSGTVAWDESPVTFTASTVYTAIITLTAKDGFTLEGVTADFFTVDGAMSVSNADNSGVITAVFPSTDATVINIADIQGVTVPVNGKVPVRIITENEQYNGIVTWNGNPSTFAASTIYSATIMLTPKSGYTLQGVSANFFKVAGAAISVSNNANSGVITAVFPPTAANVINIATIHGVTAPVNGGVPVKFIAENEQYGGTVTWNGNPYTFAASTVYTATITLMPKMGYTLQGVPANYFMVAGAMSVNNDFNSGVITAVFPMTSATVIKSVSISIIAPVKSATPSTTASAISNAENKNIFTVGQVSWSPANSPFLGKIVYTASVTLTASNGHTFTGLSSAAINGQNAAVSNNTGSAVTLSYTFPATDEKTVNGIAIKTQPTKLTYTHGDTLNLTGLVVTLTHDDRSTEDVAAANFTAKNITANPAQGNNLAYSTHDNKPVTITYGNLSVNTSNLTVNRATPTAADFNIIGTGTFTYNGNSMAVTITHKEGKSNGAITVKYNGSTTAPSAAGTYTVTFDVTEAGDFNAVNGLSAGTLTISNATPNVSDFYISGIGTYIYNDSSRTVNITPKTGKSTGTITVKYNGSTTAPSAAGTYTVTFDVAAATNFNAVNGLSAGTLMIENITPTAADFNISGIGSFYYDGHSKVVTITPKEGKSNGTITVKYNGSTTAPSAAGTYTVTFDVAAATNYNTVNGLSAGTLTIEKVTPTASDYNISGIGTFPYDGSSKTVTITPQTGKSTGTRTVKYNGSTTAPSTVGTYTVTFDVSAATNFDATSGLSAGTLTIEKVTPTASDYNISGIGTFPYDDSSKTVTITPQTGKSTGARTVKYNGSTTAPSVVGTYTVTFDVAEATNFNAASGLFAGILTIEIGTPKVDDFYINGIGTVAFDNNPWTVTITPKTGKSTGDITVKYNGSTTVPSAIGIYNITFDITETSVYYAVSELSAGTLTIITPSVFTSIDELKTYLQRTPVNTSNRPYVVALNVDNLGGAYNTNGSLGSALNTGNVSNKYVSIDLSGSTITTIPTDAFVNCTNLTSVTIADGVTNIGTYAFRGCTGLTNVTIPDGVTSIWTGAFINCTNLTSVTIPNSVKSIGDYAFVNCTSLASITIPFVGLGGGSFYFGYLFGASSYYNQDSSIPASLKTVIITGGNSISNFAFSGCTGLTSVTIPNGVTTIGNSAFSGCTGLTSVTIPNGVTTIEYNAFGDCTGLTSVTIPDNVTSIGSPAFEGCTNLNITWYYNPAFDAFSFRNYLKNVIISDGVKSIGDFAFEGSTGLTSITIPDSVTSIGMAAFNGCTGLTSVTIPDGVTSIGNGAFYNCSGIVTVTFETGSAITSANFGSDAFPGKSDEYRSDALKTAYLSNGAGTYVRTPGGSDWKKQ